MNYSTTFLNQNSENTIEVNGLSHLESRLADLRIIHNYYNCTIREIYDFLKANGYQKPMASICGDVRYSQLASDDNYSDLSSSVQSDIQEAIQDIDCSYGLCFEYVEADEDNEDYFRYQISYGGPSEEIRFYENRTEFVYLEWFSGVGFDVSNDETAMADRPQHPNY